MTMQDCVFYAVKMKVVTLYESSQGPRKENATGARMTVGPTPFLDEAADDFRANLNVLLVAQVEYCFNARY